MVGKCLPFSMNFYTEEYKCVIVFYKQCCRYFNIKHFYQYTVCVKKPIEGMCGLVQYLLLRRLASVGSSLIKCDLIYES